MIERTRNGLLLVGHGTRDSRGLADFQCLAAVLREMAVDHCVEACYLELAEPTIAAGVSRLVQAGVGQITVAPVLLFSAGHAKRDIPAAVAAAAADYPNIAIRYCEPLDGGAEILALSQKRFTEALVGRREIPSERTLLLMVGRGSSDADATAAMHRFAQARAKTAAVAKVAVCFVAMQQPSLTTALAEAREQNFGRIVVQPHLLFHGEVLAQIEAAVQTAAAGAEHGEARGTEWIVTGSLGPEPELAAAILQRTW